MGTTVSDFVWRRLGDWGVDRVFGYPGDGINGLLGALNRLEADGGSLRFIQAHGGCSLQGVARSSVHRARSQQR